MSQSNIKERIKTPPSDEHQEDDLEQYQGKWAICYVLDNGETITGDPDTWKNTKDEKYADIQYMKKDTELDNAKGFVAVLTNSQGRRAVCMFNSEEAKTDSRYLNLPFVISMFPIPIAGD